MNDYYDIVVMFLFFIMFKLIIFCFSAFKFNISVFKQLITKYTECHYTYDFLEYLNLSF